MGEAHGNDNTAQQHDEAIGATLPTWPTASSTPLLQRSILQPTHTSLLHHAAAYTEQHPACMA